MTIREVDPREGVERMKSDAAKLEDVAEMVSMNRDAFAMLTRQIYPDCPSDASALSLADLTSRILSAFAEDLKEAAARTESGEWAAKALVVDAHEMHDDNGTKH